MGIEKSKALILNKVNYSDTSLIIVALSPEEGILRLMARGFRKPPARSFAGREPIETFSEMEFSYFRSSGELHYLRECMTVSPNWPIRERYDNLVIASFAAGLTLDISGVGSEEEYGILCELYRNIGNPGSTPYFKVLRFWMRLLSLGGFLPAFDSCSGCGGAFDPEAIHYVSGRGLLCTRCSTRHGSYAIKMTRGDIRYADHILSGDQASSRIKIPPRVRQTLVSFLVGITSNEVGRQPRLLDRLRKICDNG